MKPRFYLLLYTIFLLTIFILAYLGLIPNTLNGIPHYDSIGHFVLYGLWGFFFANAFNQTVTSFNRIKIQKGIFYIVPIAICEELLQSFSPIREFSYYDMMWGLLGITIACLIINKRSYNLQQSQ